MINPLRVLAYSGWLGVEIVRGAVTVGKDVMTPGLDVSPAIVELQLRCETDLEISIFASSITITPGTVTVAIAPAAGSPEDPTPPTLFVHALHGQDRDELVAGLRDMETRVLRMCRGGEGVPA